MKPKPITFSHLLRVMQFNDVAYVTSPPAPRGSAYFVGSAKSESFFPYVSGPVHYLDREYFDSELIPVKLVNSLAKHLKIDREKFWMDADAVSSQGELPLKVSRKLI